MPRLFALALVMLAGCTLSIGGDRPNAPPRFEAVRHDRPRADDARLSVLWLGHATVLVQIDDKFVLTDPLLTSTVGQLTRRVSPVGLDASELPRLDAVVVSHLHFDHLSIGSLELIEKKTRHLFVPKGGLVYVPDFDFDARELPTWQSFEENGLRITAVPVKHVGWRYGVDAAWMTESFTGYVIEYHGMTVCFSGDTAYDARRFRATRARFPKIDLALLPIAPIHPRDFMQRTHMDPDEALAAFADLGADRMIPMHFDTLVNGTDAPGEARETLRAHASARGLDGRVSVLRIGERRVVIEITNVKP